MYTLPLTLGLSSRMSHELHCSTHDGIGAEEEESSKHQHLNGFCKIIPPAEAVVFTEN